MTKEKFTGIATFLTTMVTAGAFLIAVYSLGYATASFGVALIIAAFMIFLSVCIYDDLKLRNLIQDKSVYDESDIDFIDSRME